MSAQPMIEAAPRAARRSVDVTRWVRVGGRLAVPLVVVGAWALAATWSELVPSVGSTVSAMADGVREGWLLGPFGNTLQAVLGGFAIALVVGLPVGVVLGASRFLAATFDPVLAGLFAIPRIVLYPVLLAIFGVGMTSKLSLAVLSAFFPIAISTAAAVRDVNPTLVKLGRAQRCGPLQMARLIHLPAAAPAVMVGIRLGLSIAFISVIIAEQFAATAGIGLEVQQAYGLQQLPKMFALVVLIATVAVAANLALWWVGRRMEAHAA